MVVQVVKYGCLAPVEGASFVREQMRAQHRYHNDLIALERVRRACFREIRAQCFDLAELEGAVSELGAELAAVREAIKAARVAAGRRIPTPELNARADVVRARFKIANDQLRSARGAAREDETFRRRVAELDARALLWAKGLRAMTSAYWGSYRLAEASVAQARRGIADPTFRRARGFERVSPAEGWTGEGRIGVQIQGGMSVERLMSCEDTRLRIEPVHEDAWRSSSRGTRRRLSRTRLWFRVGSEGIAPIWSVFPLVMHRPIPEDARIKEAVVQLETVATTERWSVAITITQEPKRSSAPSSCVVAVDFGWRKLPNGGVRVAYWVDHAGLKGEIVAPPEVFRRLQKTQELRAIRDRLFNRAARWLMRWLQAAQLAGVTLPAYLHEARRYLHTWRSDTRLRRLTLERWRHARFVGDERIYPILERWAHRSRHLWQWESHSRRKALGERREGYRTVAADLARKYGTVAWKTFDISRAKALEKPERAPNLPLPARAHLHMSAPGELRKAIAQAMNREGGQVVTLATVGAVDHCHVCGGTFSDLGSELDYTCKKCGERWDQDLNAAANLLRVFRREKERR